MKILAPIVVLAIATTGCQTASRDGAPPRAQAGSLTEVPNQPPAASPSPAPEASSPPESAHPPAAQPPAAAPAPAKEARASRVPAAAAASRSQSKAASRGPAGAPDEPQSIVTRDLLASDLPPARMTRSGPEVAPSAPAPPARPAYSGPSTGTIRWSGTVDPDGLVVIDGDRSSIGTMSGALPGVPILVQLLSKDIVIVEAPGRANGWRRLTLRSRVRQSTMVVQWTVLP